MFVEPTDGLGRNIIPDVRVVERGGPQERIHDTSNGIAVAEPLVVHLEEDEPVRQGFIEIIGHQVGPSGRHGDRDPQSVEQARRTGKGTLCQEAR